MMILKKFRKRRIFSGVFCTCTFLCMYFCMASVEAQQIWTRGKAWPEVRANGKTLEMPWAGGLNACHFAAIDLNGDGKDDYIAFDRIGERLLCFSSGWQLLPDMENALPTLQYWVQSHDFDKDGRKDLFTFNGISGICVYRNVSEKTPDGFKLKFELYTKGLPAQMFGTYSPLYCTWADYPVIEDIDGDGDLDVLNFWVPTTGDFLLYYRNFAMEELQRADTFLLKIEDWSWGCFVESEESNAIILDSCSFREQTGKKTRHGKNATKHAGSTIFAVNNPQSGLFDIVVGDVGYPGLLFLHNGGTPEKAHITSYDTVFPLSQPVRLYNFPVLSQVLYKDSLFYVLSPFETDPFNAQGSQSVWRYKESGSGAAFAPLVQKDFLQEEMLDFGSGAVPVAYDYNHDGKTDLVVGNYGKYTNAYYEGGSWHTQQTAALSLLENTGTEENPAFELKTEDYLGLSRYGKRALYPAFADLDGDGASELVLGMENGELWLFRLQQDGSAELLDSLFLGETFSGFSAPTFFDLDQDGLPDLIVGEKQRTWPASPRRITKGSLSFFRNTGNAETGGLPHFEKITDSLGGVDVIDRNFSNFGYSRPSFYKNAQGEIILACGSENGEVYMYDRIAGHWQDNFRYLGRAATASSADTSHRQKIRCGLHAAPLLHDFDGDGLPELIVGNQCGGLQYFDGKSLAVTAGGEPTDNEISERPKQNGIRVYPNPTRNGFHIQVLQAGNYRLFGLNGRPLKHFCWQEGLHYVDISRLPSGIYVLMEENGRSFPYKIIKH